MNEKQVKETVKDFLDELLEQYLAETSCSEKELCLLIEEAASDWVQKNK
jgi:hypothetical protein